MSSFVGTFLIIALFVIGLPSSEGNYGDSHETMQVLDFEQALSTAKGDLKLKVEKRQGIKREAQLQTNTQRSKGIKHEQQLPTHVEKIEEIKIKDRIPTNVIENHQLLSKKQANQKIKYKAQLSEDIKKSRETKHKEQLQTSVRKSQKTKLENLIRVEMRENQGLNHGNVLHLLWKRGQGQRAGTQKSEPSHPKFKEVQQTSSAPKLKGSLHSASDTPPKGNLKGKVVNFVSNSLSKTKRVLSGSKDRSNSNTEILGNRLTSGYTKKPSGLGPINELPHTELRASQQPRRVTSVATEDGIREIFSTESPSRTPEVSQMWDFINRQSKNWSNPENFTPPDEKRATPESVNRNGSPLRPKSPPRATPSSPKTKPQNGGQRVSETKGVKDALHLIKRHKKGWSTPEGVPAKDASSTSSGEESSLKKPQAPKNSQPRSLTKSPPQNKASSNAGKSFRQHTKNEIDDKCNAYITRVKSDRGDSG